MTSIAIDFGTTRTKVAYFDKEAGEPRLIELGQEVRAVIPSLFYISKQGAPLVGDDAQQMIDLDPEGIVVGLKKEIHKLGKYRCGGGRPSIDRKELAGLLFHYIREQCEREVFHGQQVTDCVLTVPVAFEEQKRDCIRESAHIGGFLKVHVVEEPVAAARAWLVKARQKSSSHVVVCDVGGGTTDFALLQHDGGGFSSVPEVQPVGFSLGGNDVDEAILANLLDGEEGNSFAIDSKRPGFLVRLRQARESFARSQHREVLPITLDGTVLNVQKGTVDSCSAEFVDRVSGELAKFLKKCEALNGVNNPPVLLVGGGSRMPGLKAAIELLAPDRVYQWNQSDYAIVLGATITPQIQHSFLDQSQTSIKSPTIFELQKGSEIENQTQTSAKPVNTTDILALIGDGKTEEAFLLASEAILSSPDEQLFDLWIDCSIAMTDQDKVLSTARDILRRRKGDSFSICCLVFWLTFCGRHAEANHFIPQSTDEEPFALRYARFLAMEDNESPIFLRTLDQLLDERPNNPTLLLFKAKTLKDQKTKARDLIEAAFRVAPNNLSVLYELVKAAVESENSPEMAAKLISPKLRHMERISSSHFLTLFARAAYQKTCKKTNAEIETLDAAARIDYVNSSSQLMSHLLIQRALAYQTLGRTSEELKNVEELLRHQPRDLAIRSWRGKLLLVENKFTEAILDADYVLSANPKHEDSLLTRAWSRFFLWDGCASEAAKDFDYLYQINPKLNRARFGACCCLIKSHLESAIAADRRFDRCFLYPNIPMDKLTNATQSYAGGYVTNRTEVAFLFDSTFFGGARDGICITQNRLLAHNTWAPSSISIKLGEITKVEAKNDYLVINGNQINCGNISVNHKSDVLLLFQKLIIELGELHRRLDGYGKTPSAFDGFLPFLKK